METIWQREFAFAEGEIRRLHPCFKTEKEAGKKWAARVAMLRQGVRERDSLLHAFGRMTASLEDGHTNIELPYEEAFGEENLCLPIICRWLGGENEAYRLLVTETADLLRRGDIVLGVEGVPIEQWYRQVQEEIPHENDALARGRSTTYPYANYHLFSRFHLKGLVKEERPVRLSCERDGVPMDVSLPFRPHTGFADFPKPIMEWRVRDGWGMLILDECRADKETERLFDGFFRKMAEAGARRMILDLSRNRGGNSAVIGALIRRLSVESYRLYGMYVPDENGVWDCRCSPETAFSNPHESDAFLGEIFVAVSEYTFSSARTFAVTLQDNGLARIAGSAMGGVPDSYGLPIRLRTPELGIRFRVSTCRFIRPDRVAPSGKPLIDIPLSSGWDWEDDRFGRLDTVRRSAENRKDGR